MLDVSRLSAGYRRGIVVVQEFSFQVGDGMIAAIIGPNGAGKSTLLRSIAGTLKPWNGSVSLNGDDIFGKSTAVLVNSGVVFVPQERTAFPEMTCRENLLIGAWSRRRDSRFISERLDYVYSLIPELTEFSERTAGLLSGGQQRMLEIARALMSEPKCILLDEPTAGLSPALAADIYQHFTKLRAEGLSIVLVDQFVEEAVAIADHVFSMVQGKNDVSGSGADIFERLAGLVEGWLGSKQP